MHRRVLLLLGLVAALVSVRLVGRAGLPRGAGHVPADSTELGEAAGRGAPLADSPATVAGRVPLEPASPAENPRAPVLRGRLLAPDGRPYGRGEVRFAWIRHGRAELVRTKTRADGGFELFPGEPSARGDLLATAFEHELGPVARLDVAAGEQGLELRLAPARTLELRFRDQDGGELVPAELSFHWILAGVTREDEEQSLGKTRWALPPVPFRIHVHDARVVEEWLGPFEPAEVGEVLTLGLHRRPFVRGLVLAAGRPVEGAEVRLEPLAIDPGSTRLRVFPSPARTDARGEFQVRVDEPGTFQARVFHPQHGLGRSGPWTVEPERDLAGLTLELTEPAGAIAGRVVLPVGRQPEEVAIRIGDRTRTLDAEGSFTLPGLEPGLHVLQPVQGKPGAALGAWTWTNAAPLGWLTHELALLVEVRSGGTSEAVLDLVTPPPVRLAGRIEVGVEVSDATGFGNFEPQGVRFDGAARDEGRARLRAGGAFAAGFGGPGARRLRVELLLEPDLACWSVSDEVVLAPGDNRWDLALVPGKLRLVMDGAPGEELELSPQPVLRWNDGSRAIEVGARIGGLAQASPGTLLYEAVPPGRVRFVLGPGGTEFEAFVRPGETTEFRFPASARAELRAAFDVRASGLVAPSYLGDQGFY